jgi:hypothetical protein
MTTTPETVGEYAREIIKTVIKKYNNGFDADYEVEKLLEEYGEQCRKEEREKVIKFIEDETSYDIMSDATAHRLGMAILKLTNKL